MPATPREVTGLLRQWQSGDATALDRLTPLIADELHRLAHRYMRRERPGHLLQTTALVNEAFVRLAGEADADWADRAHFFAVAAQVMRHTLVDFARNHASAKRGAGAQPVTLDAELFPDERAAEVVALDDGLQSLRKLHPRASRVVELRYFGGFNNKEAADVLDISEATVERDWRFAKAWLYRELQAQ
jgi:RNA polymerase sigma factor (TIGR02999 family)